MLIRDDGAADVKQISLRVHAVPAQTHDLGTAHTQPYGQQDWDLAGIALDGLYQLADILRLKVFFDRLLHLRQADAEYVHAALLQDGANKPIGIGYGFGRDGLCLRIDSNLHVLFGDGAYITIHEGREPVFLGGFIAADSGRRENGAFACNVVVNGGGE